MFQWVTNYLIRNSHNIFVYFSKKNVMVVKLAQTLAGIKNMPSEINQLIKANTDHVSYSEDEIDYKLLVKITTKYKITLDSVEPINSGMIAVVFSGINDKKERVVVKIKRNNIRARIDSGYKSLACIYNFVYYFVYPFRAFDEALQNIKSFIDSKDYILTQCEFENEIKAMTVIRKTVEEYNKDIVIPRCYNDEDDIDFIVMEFIDGVTLFEVDDKYKKTACRLIFVFSFLTSYFGEINHSDLHPGNILIITKDDKVKLGVIDFGMSIVDTEASKDFSHGCLNFLIEYENDPTKKIDILKHCMRAVVPPIKLDTLTTEQYEEANREMCTLVRAAGNGDLTESKLHYAVVQLRKVLKCNTFSLSMDIIKYAMGLSMVQSSTRLLVKDDKEMGVELKLALREVMAY
jgi:predicted unusual protein kinase regulating ubiquinone biosynthesis (AarF/ABC1/UbiB family)